MSKVKVTGYFPPSKKGRGPLGQTAARHPFAGGANTVTITLELSDEEAARLANCSLCGRATTAGLTHSGGRPHCEICAKYTDDQGRITGWLGGPYTVDPS